MFKNVMVTRLHLNLNVCTLMCLLILGIVVVSKNGQKEFGPYFGSPWYQKAYIDVSY